MKVVNNICLLVTLFFAIIFFNCTVARQYNFSLKNTLAIFLLNNEKGYYFCIPVQYTGDYQIENFEFTSGSIQIGDYEISVKRDEINIYIYLNKEAIDPFGILDGEFNLIYSEENGGITVSKMDAPLSKKQEPDEKKNHYYIFIEKHLNKSEVKKIITEYKKGNVYSKLAIWYDLTIDNEEQNGSGMLDDFELYAGPAMDTDWFPKNLDFFKVKYLENP